ncbi:glycoside hydrolase family 16 protein [Gorillibacterium timonense]|uniref:glycoside hydrolase family 16 protein n=1 Tax=Gorillibacterium timonense TaxID=1689269 RepID=UPI00071C6D40|nr:glycoside hydrolase family 16 protein [Gorillibacterium timonense]
MTTKQGKVSEKSGWTLTFEDTFEGRELDGSKWSHCPEEVRKDGLWSDQDSFVDGDGHLVIQISERNGTYYSGAIRSKGKFEQAYGYYEIRCQLPSEEGFWTAFWLMSDTVFQVGDDGRDGTEIDIYESPYLRDSRINHALHWDGYGEHHRTEELAVHVPGIYEGFHTFALEWNENEYIFSIDGQETWRTSAGGVSQAPSYLKVTAEVGEWGGNIANAKLPTKMLVDYVRVYKRS